MVQCLSMCLPLQLRGCVQRAASSPSPRNAQSSCSCYQSYSSNSDVGTSCPPAQRGPCHVHKDPPNTKTHAQTQTRNMHKHYPDAHWLIKMQLYIQDDSDSSITDLVPGIISRANLSHDSIHPHAQFSHHSEELDLIGYCGNLYTAALTCNEELFPGQHHFLLTAQNGICLLPCVNCTQLSCIFLQLAHLRGQR